MFYNSQNIGNCALFSCTSRHDCILFSNCTKSSGSLHFSVQQFDNSNDVIPCFITKQSTPSYVGTV